MSIIPEPPPIDPILTIDEASAYLSIPKATLYTWRTRRVGFGPRAVKVGGTLRFRRSDLDQWILDHLEQHDPGMSPESDADDATAAPQLPSQRDGLMSVELESRRGKAPNPNAGRPLTRRRSPR